MPINPIASSWRMSVKELDRSSTIRGETLSTGAMVIRSSRGPVKPVKVFKGQESRLLNLFGKPSATYPDVWEAIQFNYQDDIWISAPYDDTAVLGGVLVTADGSESLAAGITPAETEAGPVYSFNSNDEYFVLASKSPTTDWLGVTVERNSTSGFLTITLYETTDGGTTYTEIDSYIVSLTAGEKDGFGKNIYIEEIFRYNDYVQVIVNDDADITDADFITFTDDTSIVAFAGGDRGSTIDIAELTNGWNYFQQMTTFPAGIFMDPTADDGVVTLLDTLRSTYQKYSYYILALPAGENAATAVTTKDGYGVSNDGLAFYWNRAKVQDTYNNSVLWTSLIGRVGKKLAQMGNIYNGGAPMWQDENDHGGQLGAGILEMEYDPTESELQTLDNAGINPIVIYPGYGPMIVSQRTGQSPNSLSDTSWIAHRRLFDYIISNTLNQVLTYQIGKLNDEYHRRLAASKGEIIMAPIQAEGLLADYFVQCDLNNNDDNARAERKFVYSLFVKVTPYSETIEFRFTNIAQTIEIAELVA